MEEEEVQFNKYIERTQKLVMDESEQQQEDEEEEEDEEEDEEDEEDEDESDEAFQKERAHSDKVFTVVN